MENKAETLTKEQYEQLGEIFRGDNKHAVDNVKSFLRNNEVKTIANSDLRQALLQEGINEGFVIKERKDILEQSKANKQFSASIKALEGLENHLGLNTKVKITESRQFNSSLQDNYQKAVKESKKVTIETKQGTANTETQDNTTDEDKE